jgi:hypothetical protein
MGKNKDVYVVHEKASDTYCGRILQGLPEHSPEFAVSYPDFVPLDLRQSMEEGISEVELAIRQRVVDRDVNAALDSIFGAERLRAFPSIRRLLRIGLASHLIHYDAFESPVYVTDPRPIIPPNATIRLTPLFTNPRIQQLRQHVAIAMPWEAHYKYYKPASGLPPHVILYAYVKSLDLQIQDIPRKLEELLDRRQMAGPLPLEQIARAVENGPRIAAMAAGMTAMAEDIRALRTAAQNNSTGEVTNNVDNRGGNDPTARLHRQYRHPDGKERRVPVSWQIPKLTVQSMYLYWHCGDETRQIPPMKYFHNSDVEHLGKSARVRLSEMRKVMGAIDAASAAKGFPAANNMDHTMANTCYFHGESAIIDLVPAQTNKGRDRLVSRMKWTTVIRFMHKKRVPNNVT